MNAPLPAEALPWSPEEFEARLRAKEARYHIHHPFNKRLNSGALQPFQVRGWVANRFYYQQAIPMKDAAVMANCDDRATRRRSCPGGRRGRRGRACGRSSGGASRGPRSWP